MASFRQSRTMAAVPSRGFHRRYPRRGTIRCRSSAHRCRPSSRSRRRRTTGRSWACATADSKSRAFSSIRRRSLPSTGTRCSAISWRGNHDVCTPRPARAPFRVTNTGASMILSVQDALQRTIEHREIFPDEMLSIMRRIMSGEVTPVMIAALTVGLRVKKETIGEIASAAQVMREFATKVDVPDHGPLVDIVGTGGDAAHTFNISTASMFVAAAAGARVAKHGNRSVSSKSGSADVLETLGANIILSPAQVTQCITETGIGFMFAPNHHSAMKHAAPVRKELGVRTIFNILGPLTNPAGAAHQLIRVLHPDLVGIHVRVLQRPGAHPARVVSGK